jgi:Protein of unknown function (DUF2911).
MPTFDYPFTSHPKSTYMKKKILISVAVIAVIAIAYLVYTVNQTSKLSPRGTSSHSFNDMDITVNYGRPSKKGRLIFGEEKDKALLPHGKYWRLGPMTPPKLPSARISHLPANP